MEAKNKKQKTMIHKNQLISPVTRMSLVMLAGVAFAQAATNSAMNQTGVNQLSGTGTSITIAAVGPYDWEFFKVPADATTGTNLSPRAERGLDPSTGGANLQGSNLTDGKKVIILKGQCDINSSSQTTIMQIFNYDSGVTDSSYPYFQLKAEKKVSGTSLWPLTVGGVEICRVNDSVFEFELRTNNKQWRLIIKQGGATIYNEIRTLNGTSGRAGVTRFRFGAYHRNGVGAKVAADVRFRGTQSSSITVSTPNTGV
ncbi:MAG: hypothetical protein ACRCXD_18810 [Luteolibacter sp.]